MVGSVDKECKEKCDHSIDSSKLKTSRATRLRRSAVDLQRLGCLAYSSRKDIMELLSIELRGTA